MAKVIFEFDDQEESNDIELVVNRHKLLNLVYELSDLYRSIYNYKLNQDEQVSVKDGKILTQEDYDKAETLIEGTKSYLSQSYIEDELDNLLEDVRHLIK